MIIRLVFALQMGRLFLQQDSVLIVQQVIEEFAVTEIALVAYRTTA